MVAAPTAFRTPVVARPSTKDTSARRFTKNAEGPPFLMSESDAGYLAVAPNSMIVATPNSMIVANRPKCLLAAAGGTHGEAV